MEETSPLQNHSWGSCSETLLGKHPEHQLLKGQVIRLPSEVPLTLMNLHWAETQQATAPPSQSSASWSLHGDQNPKQTWTARYSGKLGGGSAKGSTSNPEPGQPPGAGSLMEHWADHPSACKPLLPQSPSHLSGCPWAIRSNRLASPLTMPPISCQLLNGQIQHAFGKAKRSKALNRDFPSNFQVNEG